MEWFSALNVARYNKNSVKTNISAFPYQRETNDKESSIKLK
jgi:hypothetical protein